MDNNRKHFTELPPGKLMGLRNITDANGKFKVLALDQSNSFKKSLRAMHERLSLPQEAKHSRPLGLEPAYEEIRDSKLEMSLILGQYASAVLLDVNFGLRQSLNSFSLPKGVGLLARLEASKDAGLPGCPEPGWSVAQIKKMGADAVKLLVYMDTEDKAATENQMKFVKETYDECVKHDILLLIEELSYPSKGEDKKSPSYVARKPKNIIESAKLIGQWCDILKLEFPGDMKTQSLTDIQKNIAELNKVAIRPWVLLSAGEKFDVFLQQVELCMKNGATGIMAGRAIFNEFFEQNSAAERTKFLKTTATDRIRQLCELVDKYATSWTGRYDISNIDMAGAVTPDWYMDGRQVKPAREAAAVTADY